MSNEPCDKGLRHLSRHTASPRDTWGGTEVHLALILLSGQNGEARAGQGGKQKAQDLESTGPSQRPEGQDLMGASP